MDANPTPARDAAIARAAALFDSGELRRRLAGLVAIRSTAQEAGFEAELTRYLNEGIRPWAERLGFAVQVHDNPVAGFGPILTAGRIEDATRPTVLMYGYGREIPSA